MTDTSVSVAARCRDCGAKILWLRKAEGNHVTGYVQSPDAKPNPIDAVPVAGGNLVISRDRGLYRIATGNECQTARQTGKNLYISHFATCSRRKNK